MSTQNQNTSAENKTPLTEKPVFKKAENVAQKKLHRLEDQFVSLSSQRQLNFILGTLVLIAALIGSAGMLISLALGTLMLVQAATGNMIMNDFFDSINTKHKKWLVRACFGVIFLIILAYLVVGLTAGE